MKIASGILMLVLAAAVSESTSDVRYFRYQRAILPTPQTTGQTCFVVTPDVFAHSAPLLADLRLYRDGAEVPWALRVAAPIAVEEKTIHPLNLGVRGGKTVFDATMPDGNYSNLNISISAENFVATVKVSSSDTGNATELGSFTIFDLSKQRLGRSTVLHLPESNFRSLHFQISGPVLPEAIHGLSVEQLPTTPPKFVTVAASSSTTQKQRVTEIEFNVPENTPVDRIVFTAGSVPAAFSRDVRVTSTSTSQSTTPEDRFSSYAIATGNLLRVHREENGHRIDEERLSVETPQASMATPQKWAVNIDNGDDAPITLSSVRLEMLERRICYEAQDSGSYTLYYGDKGLTAPRYDYSRLFAAADHSRDAMLAHEEPNPRYQPRPDRRAFTERHPALLWATLIAVVALLGGIALRTAKRSAPSTH